MLIVQIEATAIRKGNTHFSSYLISYETFKSVSQHANDNLKWKENNFYVWIHKEPMELLKFVMQSMLTNYFKFQGIMFRAL